MYHYTNLPFYPVQILFFRGQPIPGDYNPSKYPAFLSNLLLYFVLNDSFTFPSYLLHPTFLPPSALDSTIKGNVTKSLRLSAMLAGQFRLSNLITVPLPIQTIVLHSFPYLLDVSLPAHVLPVHPLPAWTTIPPRITYIPTPTPIQQYHCSNVFSLPLHTPM